MMQLRALVTVIILALPRLSETFMVPQTISNHMQYFVFNSVRYTIVNIRAPWMEAKYICEADSDRLAIVDTNEIGDFVAQALASTTFMGEDFWIGAKCKPNSTNYVWINNIGVVNKSVIIARSTLEAPAVKFQRNCISVTNTYHDTYAFASLNCDLKRPFICEKVLEIQPVEEEFHSLLTTPDWISFGDYHYGIFHNKVTWKEAICACGKSHTHLAAFRNIEDVKFVGGYMLIGRPSLETAWIGGVAIDGSWTFLTGQQIPIAKNETTQFPPWPKNYDTTPAGCLTLDRHFTDDYVFIKTRCNRLQGYICSRETVKHPMYNTVIAGKIGYVIYYIKRSWENALKQCKSHSGRLAKVTEKSIHDITAIMGEQGFEVDHIWVGGRLNKNGNSFSWVHDNSQVPRSSRGILFYPPWYLAAYDKKMQCLNFDRQNHNRGIFYPADCEFPQQFICEQDDLSKMPNPKGSSKILPVEKLSSRSGNLGKQEPEEDDGINFIN